MDDNMQSLVALVTFACVPSMLFRDFCVHVLVGKRKTHNQNPHFFRSPLSETYEGIPSGSRAVGISVEILYVDEYQIAHLICARLKYDLYDFFTGCFWAFYTRKRKEAGPEHPLKKSHRSYFRRAQIR